MISFCGEAQAFSPYFALAIIVTIGIHSLRIQVPFNVKYVIDGYNLMHASPLIQNGKGPKWLEKQRFRLLSSLASLIPAADRTATVVVFDARESPSGLPAEYFFEGIVVRFARDHDEADDLIEELIEAHTKTSSLTVVSSDLRLQRAARRRNAAFCDSRVWFDQFQDALRQKTVETQSPNPEFIKDVKLDDSAVAQWLNEMGLNETGLNETGPKDTDQKSISKKEKPVNRWPKMNRSKRKPDSRK